MIDAQGGVRFVSAQDFGALEECGYGQKSASCIAGALHTRHESDCILRPCARFEPCEWSDLSCHALVDIAAVSGTPLRGIVGHHKNAGTWLKGYGEADPPTLAARLRLGLNGNVWPTLVIRLPDLNRILR